jgi:hypothetical protein
MVGAADGVPVGLDVCVATGLVIGLALADAVRVGAKVGVEEALAVGVGVLVQAAKSTAIARHIERSKVLTAIQLYRAQRPSPGARPDLVVPGSTRGSG